MKFKPRVAIIVTCSVLPIVFAFRANAGNATTSDLEKRVRALEERTAKLDKSNSSIIEHFKGDGCVAVFGGGSTPSNITPKKACEDRHLVCVLELHPQGSDVGSCNPEANQNIQPNEVVLCCAGGLS